MMDDSAKSLVSELMESRTCLWLDLTHTLIIRLRDGNTQTVYGDQEYLSSVAQSLHEMMLHRSKAAIGILGWTCVPSTIQQDPERITATQAIQNVYLVVSVSDVVSFRLEGPVPD